MNKHSNINHHASISMQAWCCCLLTTSLVPSPHPLTRKNGLVNQVKFLGLGGARGGHKTSSLYHVVCYCSFIPLSTHIFSVATLKLFIWPLQWGKSPRHIVASTTLNYLHELATPIVSSRFPPNCSTLYPLQWLEAPDSVCTMNPRWAHTHATILHKHRHVHLLLMP